VDEEGFLLGSPRVSFVIQATGYRKGEFGLSYENEYLLVARRRTWRERVEGGRVVAQKGRRQPNKNNIAVRETTAPLNAPYGRLGE